MPPESKEWTRRELVEQLHALGVQPGGVLLLLHTSFRAVRPVEGGPKGLINALLEAIGPEGTLVMPSWTGDPDSVFDPRETPAAKDLGVIADTFWRLPGVVRSDHPMAFAAHGPKSAHILQDPLPLPPHQPNSPVGRVHQLDGQILLLGVDHDANTTIHLAELMAGVPYRIPYHITVDQNGLPVKIPYAENDHCCALFKKIGDPMRKLRLQNEGQVGNAGAILTKSRSVTDTVVSMLHRHPYAFLHEPEKQCSECDLARSSLIQLGDVGDLIDKCIDKYIEQRRRFPQAGDAAKFRLLPTVVNWFSVQGILSDGTIVHGPADPYLEKLYITQNEFQRRVTVSQAVQQFSELELLRPKKPFYAEDCVPCKGTGRLASPHEKFICSCGGTGWLVPFENRNGEPDFPQLGENPKAVSVKRTN